MKVVVVVLVVVKLAAVEFGIVPIGDSSGDVDDGKSVLSDIISVLRWVLIDFSCCAIERHYLQ